MVKKLEIGPGEYPLPGYERLDMISRPGVTYVACWGRDRLPIADGAFDEVFASHVLEHVPWNRTVEALMEAARVLRSGGRVEIWVPNFACIVDSYLRHRCGDDWRRDNPDGHYMRWVNGRLFTYGPGEENWHRACFDEPYLKECLQKAGFVQIERIPARTRGTSHGRIDLGMEARKP